MRQFNSIRTTLALLVLAMGAVTGTALCAEKPRIVGDGVHGGTAGLQALLDARTSEVRFPVPKVCLLISKTLKIHSGQALIL